MSSDEDRPEPDILGLSRPSFGHDGAHALLVPLEPTGGQDVSKDEATMIEDSGPAESHSGTVRAARERPRSTSR